MGVGYKQSIDYIELHVSTQSVTRQYNNLISLQKLLQLERGQKIILSLHTDVNDPDAQLEHVLNCRKKPSVQQHHGTNPVPKERVLNLTAITG